MSTPAIPPAVFHRACPQCGKAAAIGRRFCGGCRAVLVKPCAACGFGNERDDVWCGGCGAGLNPKVASVPASVPASVVSPVPPRPPPPPPAVVRLAPPAPATAAAERPATVGPGIAELLAINARRAPLVSAGDTSDQDCLDELFGESR